MLRRYPALLRPTPLRSHSTGRLINALRARDLSNGSYQKTYSRLYSNKVSGAPQSSSSSPSQKPSYQFSEDLKSLDWPEENLTSIADEGGGFYPVRLGETFDDGRFVVLRKLGWGGFSSVWLARDLRNDRHVALKILSVHATREIEAGRLRERDALRKISSTAPSHQGFQHVVHLLHEFTFESFIGQHMCFVTDVLSYNVPNLQSEMSDPRFPLKFILRLAKHVLKGLEFVHDECKIVHSDLKPGNILLLPSDIDEVVMHELSEQPSMLYEFPKEIPPNELPFHPVTSKPLLFRLKSSPDNGFHWVIADFGSSHLQREHSRGIVQPYALRAPEVILGLEWGPAIDVWSLGCLMYEFATGHWLFSPDATDGISRDVIHLAQMAIRTGKTHDDALLESYASQKKLDDLKGVLKRADEIERKSGFALIESNFNELAVYNNGTEEVAAFLRIMQSLLTLSPDKRPSAAEALRDPIFEYID